jgi:hypothetical protein
VGSVSLILAQRDKGLKEAGASPFDRRGCGAFPTRWTSRSCQKGQDIRESEQLKDNGNLIVASTPFKPVLPRSTPQASGLPGADRDGRRGPSVRRQPHFAGWEGLQHPTTDYKHAKTHVTGAQGLSMNLRPSFGVALQKGRGQPQNLDCHEVREFCAAHKGNGRSITDGAAT